MTGSNKTNLFKSSDPLERSDGMIKTRDKNKYCLNCESVTTNKIPD